MSIILAHQQRQKGLSIGRRMWYNRGRWYERSKKMKRIFLLMMVLCLTPFAALAQQGDLPDIGAFSNGYLVMDESKSESLDYAEKRLYRGSDEAVLAVAQEYIALLTESYGLEEICHFSHVDSIGLVRTYYAFAYTESEPAMGGINSWSETGGWRINGYQVRIEYSQANDGGDEYLVIYFRPEFNYTDTGDRLAADLTPVVIEVPADGEICPYCGGDGKCDECGGDQWMLSWKWVYVDGVPESQQVREMCNGAYCTGGACSICGGTGVR